MLTSMSHRAPRVCCRQITVADLDGIADLLTRGFASQPRDFWVRGLRRLSEHRTPPGFPKYGYLLECNGAPVGAVILIFSSIVGDGEARIRCNMSSIYVEPEFRGYGAMLRLQVLKYNHVTYFNVTAGPQLWPILEAQGFTLYCSGRFVAIPALYTKSERTHVELFSADIRAGEDLRPFEIELLRAHAKYGCISLICRAANRRHPFIFLSLPESRAPRAQLIYCRDVEEFIRFAGPLGRFLLRRGFPLVGVDADCPIKGMIGRYSAHRNYFKGPDKPRIGDLAYSELVILGA
jgi:GNAT superfamily N-acetyltransferase